MKADRNDFIDVPVDRVVGESERAIFVVVEGGEFPVGKSVVDNLDEMLEADWKDPPDIVVPLWLAVQNEWIDEEDA